MSSPIINLPEIGNEVLDKLPKGCGILLLVHFPETGLQATTNMPDKDTIKLALAHVKGILGIQKL